MSGFTFKGIKAVKKILKTAKGDRTIRKWCSEINKYWGNNVISYANLQRVISNNNDCLMPHHIHWLTPFTPYEEEMLLAIARGDITLEALDDTLSGS